MADAAKADATKADAWIEKLAADIREKNREAAQVHGRDQHFAEVVDRLGKEFFVKLASQLEQDVDALRRSLQGDITSAETAVQPLRPGEVRITRERFPWIEATVSHKDDSVIVDYAKSAGLAGDPHLDRKHRVFVLKSTADDTLYAEDAFAESPERYDTPEDLARGIMELLFGV